MSYGYDQYLSIHRSNVKKGLDWIRDNLPELLNGEESKNHDYEWQIGLNHDHSKNNPEEYSAYDAYFYGGNKSYKVVKDYKKAWLTHIHNNPHHWQYWVLINDDPQEAETLIEMPDNYILEMVCDWWSFSWKTGDLNSIFPWYEKRKEYIKLHPDSRKTLESILDKIKLKLENGIDKKKGGLL